MNNSSRLFRYGVQSLMDAVKTLSWASGMALGDVASDVVQGSMALLEKHLKPANILKEAYRRSLEDAFGAVRTWINGVGWLDARWMKDLAQQAQPISMVEFRAAALAQNSIHSDHKQLLIDGTDDAIRRQLLTDLNQLEETLIKLVNADAQTHRG